MLKTIRLWFLIAIVVMGSFTETLASVCRGSGGFNEGNYGEVGIVEFWVNPGMSCCTPNQEGAAWVQRAVYVNNEYAFTYTYYVPIFVAQQAMGCNFV